MTMVFDRYPGSGSEMLLALAMADRANDEGAGIYQALATLARKSRQSDSSARRQIKRMLDGGWLIRVNAGTGGRATPNHYQINPEWIKGVSLKGFPDLPEKLPEEGFGMAREPQSEGSSTPENPSTAVTGNDGENPSNLTPFPNSNPSTAVTGNPGERVSNQPVKGVTAMTPDSYETKNSDARASAQARARGCQTQNPDFGVEAMRMSHVRSFWRNEVLNSFRTDVCLAFPEFRSQQIRQMPQRLQELIASYADPVLESAIAAEIEVGQRSKDLETRIAIAAKAEAENVVVHWRSARSTKAA